MYLSRLDMSHPQEEESRIEKTWENHSHVHDNHLDTLNGRDVYWPVLDVQRKESERPDNNDIKLQSGVGLIYSHLKILRN